MLSSTNWPSPFHFLLRAMEVGAPPCFATTVFASVGTRTGWSCIGTLLPKLCPSHTHSAFVSRIVANDPGASSFSFFPLSYRLGSAAMIFMTVNDQPPPLANATTSLWRADARIVILPCTKSAWTAKECSESAHECARIYQP